MVEPDAPDAPDDDQTADDNEAGTPGYAPDTVPWYLSWGIPGRSSGRPWTR
jgi:hypothetical protein